MRALLRKKIISVFMVCIMLALTLGGCGFSRPVKYMFGGGVNTQYKEYKKAIKPTKRKGLYVKRFEEDADNTIRFTFITQGSKGGRSLAELVDAHNTFVQENPGYFEENTSFWFTEDAGISGVYYEDYSFFSDLRDIKIYNKDGSKTDRRDYAQDLGRSNNMQLQYLFIDRTDYLGYEFSEMGFKAPVVLINLLDDKDVPVYKFNCLSSIQGLEQVVLMYCSESLDKDATVNAIHEIVPDVEVYFQVFDDNNDWHLEKIDHISEADDSEANDSDTDNSGIDISRAVVAAGREAEEVRDYIIDDFDSDGRDEAFVVIGDEIDEDWQTCYGQLWFVSEDNCEMIHEDWPFCVDSDDGKIIKTINEKGRNFIIVNESYTTDVASAIYYVENSSCNESEISRIGAFFKPSYVDDYAISVGMYDAFSDYDEGHEDEALISGHTWKHYYFYYDEDLGDFREYKGQLITEDQLSEFSDEDICGEIRSEGYEIGNIFKRDNGIINVNYYMKTVDENGSVSIEYLNANFNYMTKQWINAWEDDLNTLENSSFGGEYQESVTN